MELTQLRSFVTAARCLHFGKAAEELYLSQPSLSLQIQRLERELGAELFHRQGRRVYLSDAGAALLPLAERLLQGEEEARRTVQEVMGLERGRLVLCALPALDQHLLPSWLAQFRREHPGVELRVRELRPTRAVVQAVVQGKADLGFIQLPCPTEKRVESRVLLEEPLELVVPEEHPFAGRTTLDLKEAAAEEWVWVHEAQEATHPLFAACLQAGFTPRVVCESGSVQGVLALVAASLGIALLPRLAVEPREGTRVLSLSPAPTRTLAVVWQPDRLSHAARAFLALCR